LLLFRDEETGEAEVGEHLLHVVAGSSLETGDNDGVVQFVELPLVDEVLLFQVLDVGLESDVGEVVRLELDLLGAVVVERTQVNDVVLLALDVLEHALDDALTHTLPDHHSLLAVYDAAASRLVSVPARHEDAHQALELASEVSQEGGNAESVQEEDSDPISFEHRSHQVRQAY
jgi:hypothetical protein